MSLLNHKIYVWILFTLVSLITNQYPQEGFDGLSKDYEENIAQHIQNMAYEDDEWQCD